jgi:hypothetical protein
LFTKLASPADPQLRFSNTGGTLDTAVVAVGTDFPSSAEELLFSLLFLLAGALLSD